eukprot:4367394-Prymnesium_polylepis.1
MGMLGLASEVEQLPTTHVGAHVSYSTWCKVEAQLWNVEQHLEGQADLLDNSAAPWKLLFVMELRKDIADHHWWLHDEARVLARAYHHSTADS